MLLLLFASCAGHGSDPFTCEAPPGSYGSVELLDPATLTCEPHALDCDPRNDPPIETFDFGTCGTCRTLDPGACAAAAECRIARDTSGVFLGCYALDAAPTSPAACAGLDAATCASAPACAARYSGSAAPYAFAACEDE